MPRSTMLPAEWAPQSAVQLTWPREGGPWQPWLAAVEATFARIGSEITRRQDLLVVCAHATHRAHVEAQLQAAGADLGRCRFYFAPSEDTWARDHGPVTVLRDGRPLLLDFRFNGWGGKFESRLDDAITRTLHAGGAFGDTALESIDLILEGGSFESDGEGTLLTTTRCLLADTRNALDRTTLEARLCELLGLERILWLEHGALDGDDTDSHIDTLARFCDARTIAYQACDDAGDPHYTTLKAMEAELQALRTLDGQPYRLVPLPFPGAKHDPDSGQRLPAGYANFLIINGAVLVPTYDDPADAEALRLLAPCFPGREVIGVPCAPLILQYGSLHCVTMQLPAGVLPA